MKGIPLKTWEARAILEDRKTVTRRVVKPQPRLAFGDCSHGCYTFRGIPCEIKKMADFSPYRPGDILYVRETWQYMGCVSPDSTIAGMYIHRADWNGEQPLAWRPSIHMPREAARIFLRVKDVRVERLQDITELDILEKEGITADFPQPKPSYISFAYTEMRLKPAVRKAFSDLWESTIKPADRALYGWEANPWCWVIGFERISKEEAQN